MRAFLSLLVIAVVSLTPFGAVKATTQAQPQTPTPNGFNLTLSPLPVSLVTQPGKVVTTPIQVQNSGTQAARIKVTLMKFGANGTTGQPAILDPAPEDDFIKWATFSRTSFIAQPGVFNTITMTIKPPKEAAFGYYYAVVFSQDNGQTPVVGSQNKVNGAVASLVLLDVQAAGQKRQLDVASFTASKKLYQYLPSTFTVKVKNVGNIHTIPSGNIFISRAGSKEFLATLSLNKEQGNILPKSSRTFTAEWNDGFPNYQTKRQNGQVVTDKTGQPVTEMNWELKNANKFRIGQYTASLTMVYNDGSRDVPVSGEVSFWVIPWVPILILITVVLLVLFGLYVMVRGVQRRIRAVGKKQSNKRTEQTVEPIPKDES